MTLLVCENAISFREQLRTAYYLSGLEEKAYEAKNFIIIYDNINYLAKINTDTLFLASSNYGKLFNISQKPDPFLLLAATSAQTAVKGTSKRKHFDAMRGIGFQELPIPVPLLKRIKDVESALLEEKNAYKIDPQTEPKTSDSRHDALDTLVPHTTTHSQMKNEAEIQKNTNRHQSDTGFKNIGLISPATPISSELVLAPIRINDLEAQLLLNWYSEKIPTLYSKSYIAISKLIEKCESGYSPIWLGYVTKNMTVNISQAIQKQDFVAISNYLFGLAIFYVDPNSLLRPRVMILHASVLDEKNEKLIKDFISGVIDYVWRNVNCDEIRVELNHFQQEDGKLSAYAALKNIYIENKLKWKNIINNTAESRGEALGSIRPENAVFSNPNGIDCKNPILSFKHTAVLCIGDGTAKIKKTEKTDVIGIFSICSYLEAIKSYCKQANLVKPEFSLLGTIKTAFIKSLLEASEKYFTSVFLYF